MASATGVTAEPTTTEVFPWLKTLPLAPEYHPTLAEFQDPIAYIFKIEKEASKYGICKIVPPVTAGPKKTAIANFNRSLAARSGNSNPNSPPTFTTRQQQIGFCPRKHRPVQKPVWQSGEKYTLPQFEAKAKSFERNYLKKIPKKGLTALEIETLYWKANGDKPFSVEYANDMPGSAFVPVSLRKSKETGDSVTVGETAWNMRGVSRAKGSLLRFMKEEIPGVTSPMVYVAMMFSWFAWHVEDHDLHSLNYMHTGAGKTWYGVPRDAAVAFEEVIRVHGYGEEINPLVTFAILGEKTTVMSPEVIIGAGIPCCRLVQNAGEFVVTFPRAYHSGFSHGFNCGEAANIATPEWLRVAKDAAIRRASINCPPMVSHFQLLYDLALSLCSRIPRSIGSEPRSSRLKEKQKGEGEALIKELFVEDVMRNNELLNILGEGSSVVLLPQNSLDDAAYSNLRVAAQLQKYSRMSLESFNPEKEMKASENAFSENSMLHRKHGFEQSANSCPAQGNFSSYSDGNRLSLSISGDDDFHKAEIGKDRTHAAKLSDRGLFSCVTCGVLSFACVALVQPSEAAAQYLMSADCRNFSGRDVGSGVPGDGFPIACMTPNSPELNSHPGRTKKSSPGGLFDVPIQSADRIQTEERSLEEVFDTEAPEGPSALGLLALTYGNSSDSEEEEVGEDTPMSDSETRSRNVSPDSRQFDDNQTTSSRRLRFNDTGSPCLKRHREGTSCDRNDFDDDVPEHSTNSYEENGTPGSTSRDCNQIVEYSGEPEAVESTYVEDRYGHSMNLPVATSNSLVSPKAVRNASELEKASMLFAPRRNEDSSRLHVFCLQHAAEVRELLRPIGGALILLLCHPDYPEIEAEAKIVAEEQGTDYLWKDVSFREAAEEDEERIQSAQESEEGGHGNGDWTVKLGINLYYSASLSRSPLYSKQMPYNSIIYKAFGRCSPTNSPLTKPIKVQGKGFGKQRKIAVAGKWCGKVWMSNQVHPLIANRETEEGEMSLGFMTEPEARQEKRKAVTAAPKTGKKRKNVAEAREIITYQKRKVGGALPKAKRSKVEEPDSASDHSEEETCRSRNRGNPKSRKPRPETPPPPLSRQFEMSSDTDMEGGPSTRLRRRIRKPKRDLDSPPTKPVTTRKPPKKKATGKKVKKSAAACSGGEEEEMVEEVEEDEEVEEPYKCELEGCTMSFHTKQELVLHKRNICPVKGCGKKFFSHKYLVQHRRVHDDDRPLKCPWKGCKMAFKWAWARTEHIRVHTGARPYVCAHPDCGQTFRFVSDFSRHKRKTGHNPRKGRG